MADRFRADELAEMRQQGFSEGSILILDALSEFSRALDSVYFGWLQTAGPLRSDGPLREPLERLFESRSDFRKRIGNSVIVPPAGQTATQYSAGLLGLIEEAFHLFRFLLTPEAVAKYTDHEAQRRLTQMIDRPPAIHDELRRAVLHLKAVALLEARAARYVSGKKPDGVQQPPEDGPLEPDGFRFDGKPAWRLTPDEKKLMTFVWSKRDAPPTWIDAAFHLCPTKRVNGMPVASRDDFNDTLHRLKKKLVDQKWTACIHFAGRGATTAGKLVLREPVKRSKTPAATKRRSTVTKLSKGGSSNKRLTKKKRASNA